MKPIPIFSHYSDAPKLPVHLAYIEILCEVLLVCKINFKDFFGDKRNQDKVNARVIFTEFALRNGSNFYQIGKFIGKHHSTVQYYSDVLKLLQTTDKEFTKKFVEIEINIGYLKSQITMPQECFNKAYYTGKDFKKIIIENSNQIAIEMTERFTNIATKILAISQMGAIPDIDELSNVFSADATMAIHRKIIENSKNNGNNT